MDQERGGGVVGDEGDALPSRAAAIESTRAALDGEPGPILLTGEAGAGKTWLVNRLAADRVVARRWLAVDLAPTTDPADFYCALGHGLGLYADEGARRPLGDFLAEQAVEGRDWVLVVDEAHNASADVLEELRLLSNRLGRPDGFAGLILAAQTRLARRLDTASLAGLAARISARVHLRPIDADEAADLLTLLRFREGRSWSRAEVDDLHREAGGNPRRLLRLANAGAPRPGDARLGARTPAPQRLLEPAATASEPPVRPRLGADRPPLRIEEGLIEVGWAGPELEDEPAAAPSPMLLPAETETAVEESSEGAGEDEPVRDHYAALQAWDEWARNQGRQPAIAEVSAPPIAPDDDSQDEDPPLVQSHPSQDFAPYSQLFSRLKRAVTDAESLRSLGDTQ